MSKKGKVITIILVIAGLVFFVYFYKEQLWSLYLTKVVSQETNGQLVYQEGNKLVANFPIGFPVYPGSKLISSWTIKSESGNGMSAVWETSIDPSQAALFYKTELVKTGWQMSSSYEQPNSYNYSFSKDSVTGLVGITKSGEATTISVAIGNK